jgi:hypothetical protein
MNPDGISYLDVGDSFYRHDWANAINAWWSQLYPGTAGVAQELGRRGVRPGDKVGVIGDGTGAYWARLSKVRIVAEIMDMNHGSREFWQSPAEVQQKVFRAFAQAHATAVVAVCLSCPPETPDGWLSIVGTPYCMRQIVAGQ